MKIAIAAITSEGKKLGEQLAEKLPNAFYLSKENNQKIAKLLADNWYKYDAFICIMAAGITVRSIAGLLKDKFSDPCVLTLDDQGKFIISLLSGHIGGGNELAKTVADVTGGVPVITTASDVHGLFAFDLWARQQGLVTDRSTLTKAASLLVEKRKLKLYCEVESESLPVELQLTESMESADIIVSNRAPFSKGKLVLRPKNLVIGIGCNRNTPEMEFKESLDELFGELALCKESIRNIASIDKKADEIGLLAFADSLGVEIEFYPSNEINQLENLSISPAALKAVGAIGVAEPTAILSAGTSLLLCRKRKWKNITMAIAQAPFTLSGQVLDQKVL